METRRFLVPDEVKVSVDRQVVDRKFSSIDEYLLNLIQQDLKRGALMELEAQIVAGLEGPTTPMNEDFWDSIRRQAAAGLAAEEFLP